jgi:hypothetical protein
MPEVFMLFIVLAIPAVVILMPSWLRSQDRRRVLEALSAAADKGVALPSEHVAVLLAGVRPVRPPPPDHVRDTRLGVLLLAVAAGFALIGLAVAAIVQASGASFAPAVFVAIAAVGAIPGLIGVAYLWLARLGRRAA